MSRYDSPSLRIHLDIRRLIIHVCLAALVLIPGGCGSDVPMHPPPMTDGAAIFWDVEIDHQGVTLSTVAPYDTITLHAVPVNAVGAPLDDLPPIIWASGDAQRATVDSNGIVHALKTGSNIPIIALTRQGNLVHADTARLTITSVAAPPVLGALSIHPVAPDSAKTSVGTAKTLTARATNGVTGTPISGLSVAYSSSDLTVATIASGRVTGIRPGRVTFVAAATAYGVTKVDTLPFVIGYPTGVYLSIEGRYDAMGQRTWGFPSVTVGVGGWVVFTNTQGGGGPTIDVVFDDSLHVASGNVPSNTYCRNSPLVCSDSGNIAPFSRAIDSLNNVATGISAGLRARRFPIPGTYTFHSVLQGTSGKIIVAEDPTP